jgi:hypothetical protein
MILRISQAGQCDVDIRITGFSFQMPENEILLFTADILNGLLDFSVHFLLDPGG